MMKNAIELNEVFFRYGTAAWALNGIDLSIREGEMFAILGPNGSGKSSLFRLLSTYQSAQRGRIVFFGRALDSHATLREVRQQMGTCFQNPSLDAYLTVMENLQCYGQVYGLSRKSVVERAEHFLKRLGVWDKRSARVQTLSGGQKRKVEISKVLLTKAKLLLLDEPTTGLDPESRAELWHILKSLAKDGLTLVFTTHLMEEADQVDRLCFLKQGRITVTGTPKEIKAPLPGRVVSVQAKDLSAMCDILRNELGVGVSQQEDILYFGETDEQHFSSILMERHGHQIQSLTIREPSMNDAYFWHNQLGLRSFS